MDNIAKELEQLKQDSMFRQISNIEKKEDIYIYSDGLKMINLSSNDYLNLSTDRGLVQEFLTEHKNHSELSFSSASARLLSGTSQIYKTLERTISQMFNKEATLLFNTGYQCNLGVITSLISKGDVVFSDKLNHASIIDGMKLSDGDFYRYKHLDYEHLEELLIKHRHKYKRVIIISESVFSMDGDVCDISKLIELRNKYNTLLMIDEAHAFCSIDDNCAGFSAYNQEVDIVTATFGKATASTGAFVTSNKLIVDYITNKARSFIFSTTIPPINVLWTNWLLTKKRDLIEFQKEKLIKLTIRTHEYLLKNGINTVSETQIIPIVLNTPQKATEIAKKLKDSGFFVLPIKPPTVPIGTSRLRLSLTANMKTEDIIKLIELIKDEI